MTDERSSKPQNVDPVGGRPVVPSGPAWVPLNGFIPNDPDEAVAGTQGPRGPQRAAKPAGKRAGPVNATSPVSEPPQMPNTGFKVMQIQHPVSNADGKTPPKAVPAPKPPTPPTKKSPKMKKGK